jgi:hypothetical protein
MVSALRARTFPDQPARSGEAIHVLDQEPAALIEDACRAGTR